MANRYWVLGTGTWSSTNTANWSTSSGGAGGASVPIVSDNVYFDANSNVGTGAFTVTMANTPRGCNDFTASGLDGTMTLAGTSIDLIVLGSLTFQATNFTRTYTGTTTFAATTTGKTVTTNGVAFGGTVDFNGVGGGWTLGSALSCGANTLAITNGTFNTSSSGNYAVTASSLNASGATARTINLNASTVTLSVSGSAWLSTTTTNLTFNAGTSTINCLGSFITFAGGSLTYYNVAFTSTGIVSASITGANTFNNLTITGQTNVGLAQLSISANQTINGTFTVSAGTASAYRISFFSSIVNTTRTLTCAAVSLTDVDFRDITIAGAAAPATGTRIGDGRGNSGITFTAAKTVYYRQTGSANWAATGSGSWSATSGGALDATQFPLPQDTAVFPAATYPASGSTTTVNGALWFGTIDMSLRTSNTMTLANGSNAISVFGNWINGTGITLTGTGLLNFAGRTTQQITSDGRTFVQPITINSPSGSVTLQDALTTGTGVTTTLTNGTLNLQSYTLSTGLFNSNNLNTRTLAFGTGQISCTGVAQVWTTLNNTGLTTTGTQVVNVTSTGAIAITVLTSGLSEANSISFNFTGGTYALTFLGSTNYSARDVNFTGYAGTWNATGNNAVIYGNLTLASGMTLTTTTNALRFGATSGTKTITTNAKTLDFPLTFNGVGGAWQLQDAMTLGATRRVGWNAGTTDLNGFTLTAGIGTAFNTTSSRNITFNSGSLILVGSGTSAWSGSGSNFTTTAGTGTGTISMTAATAKTFDGNGFTYNCTLNQGGAGDLTITGSNTFLDITNTVQPASILFTAGTTNTFLSGFSLSGTAGNLITIGSVTAASHTLSKASGTVSVSFCSISNSTATGGAAWEAFTANGNVDGGNNTGWSFVVVLAFIYETATATDAVLSLAAFLSVLAETATATDAVLSQAAFNSVLSETATATDSPSVAASTFNAPVAETATATDSPSVAASTFNAPVAETTTATDSVLSLADFYAALAETATATDAVLSFVDFYAALAETATATDAVLSLADFYAALVETATATDSPLVAPSTFNAPVAETATATDSPLVAPSTFNAPVSETVTISDLVLGAYLWNLIDDSQSVTWQNVNSSPGTTWSPIDTDPNTGWTDIPTVN